MLEQRYRWKNKQLREHVAVLDGQLSPTIVLKQATYLNQMMRQWVTANIWISDDRIVYIGEQMPTKMTGEVVDCRGQFVVPGYIEPHAHPFQLYNPHSLAHYASKTGTTTLINDNLMLLLLLRKKKAFSFLAQMRQLPVSMYWWCRLDAQTELDNEDEVFSYGLMKEWLDHDLVVQAGELTGWPKLLAGDDLMLHWIQEAKRRGKRVEGHFPGASEKTLAKMLLLGADCDHEAMTADEALTRLQLGYMTSLRYSSIRPDLPNILAGLVGRGVASWDRFMMNTDGSTPSFYAQGMADRLVKIAIEAGVPLIDAYNMVSQNVARYYGFEHLHGTITVGRVANLNVLAAQDEPTPVSVLGKGKWLVRDGQETTLFPAYNWATSEFQPLELDWQLTNDDLQFSSPFGMKLENAVIMKPYSLTFDFHTEALHDGHDENFLVLLDRCGKWRINTAIKGFATNLHGLASSFSNTGDIFLIGKRKHDMKVAFERMKQLGGGIVLAENGEIIYEIALPLEGGMSSLPLEELIVKTTELQTVMSERGYTFGDPIYTLLFLSSTHLPYIRITPRGIYDVMKKQILFPAIMR